MWTSKWMKAGMRIFRLSCTSSSSSSCSASCFPAAVTKNIEWPCRSGLFSQVKERIIQSVSRPVRHPLLCEQRTEKMYRLTNLALVAPETWPSEGAYVGTGASGWFYLKLRPIYLSATQAFCLRIYHCPIKKEICLCRPRYRSWWFSIAPGNIYFLFSDQDPATAESIIR